MNTEITLTLTILNQSHSGWPYGPPVKLASKPYGNLPLIPVGHTLSIGESVVMQVTDSRIDLIDNSQYLECSWSVMFNSTAEQKREQAISSCELYGFRRL